MNKKAIEAVMEAEASRRYQDVAYDLPRPGNFHYHATCDHLGDWLHDKFYKRFPEADFGKIAKRVALRYMSSDTKESKRNEARREKQRAMKSSMERYKRIFGKPKTAKYKAWDQVKPTHKGIGSY